MYSLTCNAHAVGLLQVFLHENNILAISGLHMIKVKLELITSYNMIVFTLLTKLILTFLDRNLRILEPWDREKFQIYKLGMWE